MAGKVAEKGTLDNESRPVSMSSLKERGAIAFEVLHSAEESISLSRKNEPGAVSFCPWVSCSKCTCCPLLNPNPVCCLSLWNQFERSTFLIPFCLYSHVHAATSPTTGAVTPSKDGFWLRHINGHLGAVRDYHWAPGVRRVGISGGGWGWGETVTL